MSNLHDVPLAEPENIQSTEQNLNVPKTNSLKRFFKLGRRSNSSQEIGEETCEPEDEGTKETTKPPGSISRFLTKLKGPSRSGMLLYNALVTQRIILVIQYLTDTADPNSSYSETRERPAPNPRLNLKTSISSYWKVLFNRQKTSPRRGVNTEQESGREEEEIETTDLQQVQQEQQTDPVKFDDAEISVTPETSVLDIKGKADQDMVNPIPAMSEEVHVLPISDETVSPLQDKMLND